MRLIGHCVGLLNAKSIFQLIGTEAAGFGERSDSTAIISKRWHLGVSPVVVVVVIHLTVHRIISSIIMCVLCGLHETLTHHFRNYTYDTTRQPVFFLCVCVCRCYTICHVIVRQCGIVSRLARLS